MKTNAIGTIADKNSGVDISKVFGNYFSNTKNLDAFVSLGIAPIKNNLPKSVNYIDFGGGQGHLAFCVKEYLQTAGFKVITTVADANDGYLELSKKKGLETKLSNLDNVDFKDVDLITMRAVLHYNTPADQISILKNIFKSLKKGGYLVHQNSSGNIENCELRSAIVNIVELGRAGSGNYHWASESEYEEELKQAGFTNIIHAGYAPPGTWGPESQWERFNDEKTKKAIDAGDIRSSTDLEEKRKVYLAKAYKLIGEYSSKYGKEYLGIKDLPDGKVVIEYLYPIIISRK